MIPKNGSKMDGVGPSWTGLIAVIAIGIGIWQIVDPRVNLSELKTEFRTIFTKLEDKIDRNAAEVVKEREMLRRETVTQAEHLEFKTREDARLFTIEQFIRDLNAGTVTRSEHIQHWAETDARINQIKDQITELRNKFDTIYNSGDALKSIQKQIDDLRNHGSPPTNGH